MIHRPPIVLPVENQVREFDAKLLLACVAAERGFPVVIGCHTRIGARMHQFSRAIYVAKAVSPGSMKLFRILRRLGHAIVAWDEEALVYMSPEFYLRRKVGAESLGTPQALFAWGEDNAANWRGAPGYKGQPLFVTGNPRADLLRPDLRAFYAPMVEELRRMFGDFVLINSNFGSQNFFFPALNKARVPAEGEAAGQAVPPEKVGTWDDPEMCLYRDALFRAFQEMLPELARRFPQRQFVMRPHPSESHDLWRQIAAGCPNVRVIAKGSIVPWALAASALVHNGCTTGVEAFLLGRPVIAYQPVTHPIYDMWFPNALSDPASDIDGLAAAIDRLAASGAPQPDAERSRIAARFVAAQDGPLASDRIVDALEGLVEGGGLFRRPPLGEWLRGQYSSRRRNIKKRISARKTDRHDSEEYLQHRFPDLTLADVEEHVERLRAASGRFGRVTVRERSKNIFELGER